MSNKESKVEYLKSDEWLNFKSPSKVNVTETDNDRTHVSFRLSPKYVEAIDSEVAKGKYTNRSEFFRDVIRNYFFMEKASEEPE